MKKLWYLLIPLLLSIWGTSYGLPLHLIGDEESLIGGALKMLELKQLFPVLAPAAFKFLYYPVLIPYLIIIGSMPVFFWQFIVLHGDLLAIKDYFLLNLDTIWLSSRLLSGIFSLGVIVVIYKLTQRLLSDKAAVLSAILLSLSFFQINLAHWTRHWTFGVFFVYLAILLAVNFVQGRIKKYWLIGIVGAVSLATVYTAILGFGIAILLLWLNRHKISKVYKVLLFNILIFIIGGSVLVYLNWPDVQRVLLGETVSGEAKTWLGLFATLGQVAWVLFRQELIIFILFLLSLFLWRRQPKLKIFIISSSILYLAVLYYFVHFELRYVYLLIPALVMLAADSLVWLEEKINNKKLFYIFFGIILLWPLATIVRYDYLLTKSDTRQLAMNYIQENIGDQNFILSSEYIYLPRTKMALEQADAYGRINATERYILSNYDRLSNSLGPSYNYQNIHFWDKDKLTVEAAQSYSRDLQNSYFIVDYWQASDLTEVEDFWRNSGILVEKFSQNTQNTAYDVNADFAAFNSILFTMDRLGPIVEIYKLY